MKSSDVLRAHVFQVVKSDGNVAQVIIHAKKDGTIGRITGGHLLKHLLGPEPAPATTSPGMKISANKAKRDISFFDEKVPCWFEGCEDLRSEYAVKKQEIENSGAPCIPCNINTLMRQYLLLLERTDTEG